MPGRAGAPSSFAPGDTPGRLHLLHTCRTVCNGLRMPETTPTLIGTTEAMRILGVSRATLSRWAGAGKIATAGKLEGDRGALIFHLADVEAMAVKLASEGATA